jgi:HlyD family secretion protein
MKRWAVRIVAATLSLAAVAGLVAWFTSDGPDDSYTTFAVRRGPLEIKVVEGGNIEALESQEIKSQVKGWQGTKILSIVDEGYFVTAEDVSSKKVLVELDSSELQEKLTTSEISFRGTQAQLTEALKGYDIQVNQSESDIYAAELETKFAQLEMEKYLGSEVMRAILELVERSDAVKPLGEESLSLDAAAVPVEIAAEGDAAPLSDEPAEIAIEELRLNHPEIDFSEYATVERLGDGAANQELSKLTSEVKLAQQERAKAESDMEGKLRLYERKYLTENDFKAAQLAFERQAAGVDAAEKALEIFIEYEFPKQAEKLMSDYIQAKRKLERTEQTALSQIAQARAKMASAQAQFRIEQERIQEYRDQIEKCVMVAEREGLVVYGGSGPNYWNEEPIKEGATVRERQAIITIPDMAKMAVKVNIHESDIKKVAVGQRVRIRIDAFPDRRLMGEVAKVAVLPDAENRWMNPDLKVYQTTIRIEGRHDWIKPGMSAETEVLIKRLDDAIYVPIQSVVPQGDEQVVFVAGGAEPERRVVETGEITVEYITITKGLSEGERILIRPPAGSRKDDREPGTHDTEAFPEETPAEPDAEPITDERTEAAKPVTGD